MIFIKKVFVDMSRDSSFVFEYKSTYKILFYIVKLHFFSQHPANHLDLTFHKVIKLSAVALDVHY